jgi:proline racemase
VDGRAAEGKSRKLITIRTIDAHVAGQPLRLIVGGFPAPAGRTMLARREWLRARADHLRRAVLLEPRGHADICGAILTEAVSPDCHAGLLFMDADGYSTMSAHSVVAATTIALDRGLLMTPGGGTRILYDTPAGLVRASAVFNESTTDAGPHEREADGAAQRRVERVDVVNVPSFVLRGGLPVQVAARRVRIDVAFGGGFYAIADAEAVGVPLDAAHLPELRRAAAEIVRGLDAAMKIAHPVSPALTGLSGVVLTGPPHGGRADLRTVTVFAGGRVDRSPGGTGMSAVMAVLDAMGLLGDDRPFVAESIVGTLLEARVTGRTMVGEIEAILPEISGSAWITGDHTFFVEDDDPLREGFRI